MNRINELRKSCSSILVLSSGVSVREECLTYQLICSQSDDFNLAVIGALRIVTRRGRPWSCSAAITVVWKEKSGLSIRK